MIGWGWRGAGSPRRRPAGPGRCCLIAARLWELRQSDSPYIDVTVPSRNGQKGTTGHSRPPDRAASAGWGDGAARHSGHDPARTLLDLTDVLERQALKRVITEADRSVRGRPRAARHRTTANRAPHRGL